MSSIRRTLLVWLLAGLAVIALAASAATYVAARREIGALLDLQLKQLAYSTRIDDLLRGRRPGFDTPDALPGTGITELVTQIWDRDGVLVYWTQPGTGLPVPVREGYSTVSRNDRTWRVYTMVHGSHALQIAQPQDERDALATQTALRTLIPFAALMPVFGVLIWLGVGTGLRPLESLSRAVGKRRADAMAPIDEAGLPGELRPLGESLNGLLARLSDALSAQRRFTADAAHELRTPLAALTLQLDLARRSGTPGELVASLADLEAGVARASHVVEQLMTLARVEPEALAMQKSRCDLVAIAKEAIVARAALAESKSIDLGLARAEAASVDGDPAALAILLSNLVDNALRYTPADGRIDVSVTCPGGVPVLEVADTGPGIPAAERERVFDRFYRGVHTGEPGSGLGLSIVKRIADAHGATISLDAQEGGAREGSGLVVRVRFGR
ncbi:MAG: two-component sensor histidine kinase [Proteobacteria bacterium]|jgi:two-component system OmpR family sensor kinase|nr:two-component sensor histidine kinase [Pseudomonadota bacterium]